MSGKVAAPLLNIISLINEVDLYKEWIPFLKVAKEVTGQGIRKVVHLLMDLPWPVAKRECHIFGYSADDLEGSGSIIIFMRDCTPDDLEAMGSSALSPLDSVAIRAKIKLAGMLLKPTTETETTVTMLANVDPCLASVPYWLLNMVTRNAMPMMFSLFSSLSTNIEGTEHARRIQQDTNKFYSEVRARLAARGWGPRP